MRLRATGYYGCCAAVGNASTDRPWTIEVARILIHISLASAGELRGNPRTLANALRAIVDEVGWIAGRDTDPFSQCIFLFEK